MVLGKQATRVREAQQVCLPLPTAVCFPFSPTVFSKQSKEEKADIQKRKCSKQLLPSFLESLLSFHWLQVLKSGKKIFGICLVCRNA